MNTFHVRELIDGFHVVERFPDGREMPMIRLMSEEHAEEWLATYLRLQNLNSLAGWLNQRAA